MLHAVLDYARATLPNSEPGFIERPLGWLIELTASGEFSGAVPLSNRRERREVRERCPEMRNMRAGRTGKRSHFLVETIKAALLYVKDKDSHFLVRDDDTTQRRHAFFAELTAQASRSLPALKALKMFLENETELGRARKQLGEAGANENDWIKFRIDGFDPLTDAAVLAWWREWFARDKTQPVKSGHTQGASEAVVDLLTGELVVPARTHAPVKGLSDVGGNAETPLVTFDKDAFCSFGLDAALNAAVSEVNAKLYADGLTDLLRKSHVLAGARVAHWYKAPIEDVLDPLAWIEGLYSDAQRAASALAEARALLDSIRAGSRITSASNRFYAITLSGSTGRAMVRDWMEGSFEELLTNAVRWFSDLEIVSVSGERPAPDPKLETVVTCLLAEKKQAQKYSDWIKAVGAARSDLWHAALNYQRSIPPATLARIVALLPAFFMRDDVKKLLSPAKPIEDSETGLLLARLYARMGLIKAYFIRSIPGGESIMKPHLNPDHPEPAYHCGRLLAVLAGLQRSALGDVGAGVVQRYYPAMSQTPGLTLGRLIANSRNHLSKLEGGLPWWYEQQIAEIMSRIGDSAPRMLDLIGQGLFALGYYQQLAALRAPTKIVNEDTEPGEQ